MRLWMILLLAISGCTSTLLIEPTANDAGHVCVLPDLGSTGVDSGDSRDDGGMLRCAIDIRAPGLALVANGNATCENAVNNIAAFFDSSAGPAFLTVYKDGHVISLAIGDAAVSCPGDVTVDGTTWSAASTCINGSIAF